MHKNIIYTFYCTWYIFISVFSLVNLYNTYYIIYTHSERTHTHTDILCTSGIRVSMMFWLFVLFILFYFLFLYYIFLRNSSCKFCGVTFFLFSLFHFTFNTQTINNNKKTCDEIFFSLLLHPKIQQTTRYLLCIHKVYNIFICTGYIMYFF